MIHSPRLVAVVDDDVSIRESVGGLVKQLGFSPCAFSSAEEFLASGCAASAACLVLDVGLPGMSGPALQTALIARGWKIPTVFVTGQEDERVLAGLRGQGAVNCLIKPFSDADLARALETAFSRG